LRLRRNESHLEEERVRGVSGRDRRLLVRKHFDKACLVCAPGECELIHGILSFTDREACLNKEHCAIVAAQAKAKSRLLERRPRNVQGYARPERLPRRANTGQRQRRRATYRRRSSRRASGDTSALATTSARMPWMTAKSSAASAASRPAKRASMYAFSGVTKSTGSPCAGVETKAEVHV
jgi:hypothetical protein